MGPPPPFDAVLFDLDGTLVATDRFWVQAARTGARRAFAELGIEREVPSARQWMELVGQPVDEEFGRLFPDLDDDQVEIVQDACMNEERRLLEAGGAALMPGAEQTLLRLREAGVKLGIASNCSSGYLTHMLDRLGIGELVDEARCLDSRGVSDKAEMIEQQLAAFETRSALMVGDRGLDRDAAWANGLPHVHCAFGFAPRDEDVSAEATIEDLGELPAVLARRRDWIERSLEEVGLFRPTLRPPLVLGITGPVAAGKSLFARDAARLIDARGIPCGVVSLEAFRQPADAASATTVPADPLAETFDVEALFDDVLEPARRGEPVRLLRTAPDRLGIPHEHRIDLPARSVLVLEGPWLADPRLRSRVERLIHLEIPDELVLRRVAGREGRLFGPRSLEGIRGIELPAGRAFDARYPPRRLADLVLDASNPLGAAPGG